MDMTNRHSGLSRAHATSPVQADHALRPYALLEALWRRKFVVLMTALVAGLMAASIGLMMPRSYTSTTQLLIDPRGLKVMEKDIAPQAREPDLSVSIIESEMRIIASDLVLQRVIAKLDLASDSSAATPTRPLPGMAMLEPVIARIKAFREQAKAMIGRTDNVSSPQQAALLALQKSVRVSRQPSTYVVDIAVSGKDRDLAARIANTIAAEYIGARFDSRAEATRRAAQSIDGRLEELRSKVREADAAVERYKEENGLTKSAGRLLTEQAIGELSTQLQAARAETVRARSRADEIRAARASGGAMGLSIEALQSPALERLRTNQALARQREAALTATLLPSHPLVRQMRQEIQSTERSVSQELARIADSANAALERASATENALERDMRDMSQAAARDGAALVQLRELERIADANRSVYESFLVRTRELVEQQRIDPNLAVVLAAAEPARDAGGPGIMPMVMAASLGGLGLGGALALRRDNRDPRVRSQLQLEALLTPDRVHEVPVSLAKLRLSAGSGTTAERALYFAALPGSDTATALDKLNRTLSSAGRPGGPRLHVVVASAPYQGKSTIALNLAAAAARAGENVLLVDADRGTTRATIDAEATENPGLAEVIAGTAICEAAIVQRSEPPFDLLPAGKLADLRVTRAKLDKLGESLIGPIAGYDVVIVDAASAPGDRLTAAFAARADSCILVVREGASMKSAIGETTAWLEGVAGGEIHAVLVGRG
jgi:uncharacterized protein involved in exopolysaccharide biosynthesis/Mrp family chromosome partitioning ATPase